MDKLDTFPECFGPDSDLEFIEDLVQDMIQEHHEAITNITSLYKKNEMSIALLERIGSEARVCINNLDTELSYFENTAVHLALRETDQKKEVPENPSISPFKKDSIAVPLKNSSDLSLMVKDLIQEMIYHHKVAMAKMGLALQYEMDSISMPLIEKIGSAAKECVKNLDTVLCVFENKLIKLAIAEID